ncbi:MAG: hypothetical protein QOG85_826 [Gaiellaceae bacterium]|jgi:hypothetical protein|nr:hypothetical protein [Gaiellaceae bacterium]
MPNHVTTICTVTGPPADVAAFVERHFSPMLCDTHDDCKASPALAAACLNRKHFDFETVIPMPKVLEGTHSPSRGDEHNRRAEAETGFSNWYDWAVEKWGTKWGAYDYEERERGDGRYVFKFETAWSVPEPILRKLAELHETLTFDLVAFDEGWNFGGVGQFNGRHDFRVEKELATAEMYERVYGRKPDIDDDDEASPTGSEEP